MPELRAQAKLAVKDEYTFDFLELGEEHSERELERALIARIEDFLRAMGGLYAFMGSRYPLAVDGEEFLIDLLLFHRRLRCLVAIELKIGKFKPEFVGKMQFYLTALDRQIRQEDENPSIGIILCKEKNRTIVEYALHDARNPIGVATYEITKTLPKELRGNCPNRKRSRHCWQGLRHEQASNITRDMPHRPPPTAPRSGGRCPGAGFLAVRPRSGSGSLCHVARPGRWRSPPP